MNISVLQENLKPALAAVTKAVENKPALPVLANVLLVTEDDRLRITGTDLEVTYTVWIGAKVHTPGSVTLPAKTFKELVANLPSERVDLVLDEVSQTVHLSCGNTSSNIKGITADEFPAVPQSDEFDFSINGEDLKQILAETQVCAARDVSRPILGGVYFEAHGNTLTLAAADGYRLAVRTIEVEQTFAEPRIAVLPVRAISALLPTIDTDDIYRVTLPERNDGKFYFTGGSAQVVAMAIEGRFPDFTTIIPRSPNTNIAAHNDDLTKAAKRSMIFARDNANSMRIVVEPPLHPGGDGDLKIIGKSAERGDNEGHVSASIEGEALDVNVNGTYLVDVLGTLPEDRVVLEFSGGNSPVLIRPFGRRDDNLLYVIMPMSRAR